MSAIRFLPVLRLLSIALVTFWAATARSETYRIVTLEFPPLEFEGAKGKAVGAVVEIVAEVMKMLGHTVEIEVLPWTRSLNLTKEGKAAAIFTAYKIPERELFLDYGNEVLIPQVVSLYVKKGSGLRFEGDLKELVGRTIGIISTISYGAKFDEARAKLGLRTERVDSLDLNLKKLVAGRIDYVISNRYSAQVEIDRLELKEFVDELPVMVEVTPSYIAFSKKAQLIGLRDKFDAALREMKKSGRYYEILEGFKVRVPKEAE